MSPLLAHAAAASAVRRARVVRGRPSRLATKPSTIAASLLPKGVPNPNTVVVIVAKLGDAAVTGGNRGARTGRRTVTVTSASRSSGRGVSKGRTPRLRQRWQAVEGKKAPIVELGLVPDGRERDRSEEQRKAEL